MLAVVCQRTPQQACLQARSILTSDRSAAKTRLPARLRSLGAAPLACTGPPCSRRWGRQWLQAALRWRLLTVRL